MNSIVEPTLDGGAESRAVRRTLLEGFAGGEKGCETTVVGTEFERFGVTPDGRALPYDDPSGGPSIRRLLEGMREHLGWKPIEDKGHLVGLDNGAGATVTLEPGGQFEFSGAPHRTITAAVDEFDAHAASVDAITAEMPVRWLFAGHHPLFGAAQLPWMPKARYDIMRRYLPTRGKLALHMMQRTCTVQANLDYRDEPDMGRKFRAAMGVSSIITAMFANSPLLEGKPSGYKSFRAHVWTDVDPDRCGLPDFVFEGDGPTYERYLDYALDVPLFFIVRDGKYIECAGLPFRQFLDEGFRGHRPTIDDWKLHLSTIFTEVRLKSYLEFRGADCVAPRLLPSLPALCCGLLYNQTALDSAWDLVKSWSMTDRHEHREAAAKHGLAARTPRGHKTADLARELLAMARYGLVEIARDSEGCDESGWLDPLEELTSKGECPADRTLAWLSEGKRTTGDILAHYERSWPEERAAAPEGKVSPLCG